VNDISSFLASVYPEVEQPTRSRHFIWKLDELEEKMAPEAQAKKQKAFRETAIEDAIIARPDKLGFPGALAIRNLRVADTSGAVDVVLLPQIGSSFKLVLVEAKAARAQDAGSKVVGQLLMYTQVP